MSASGNASFVPGAGSDQPGRRADSAAGGASIRSRAAHWVRLSRLLGRYGRGHRRVLMLGALAALAVVALRLALPWPIRAALQPFLTTGSAAPSNAGAEAAASPERWAALAGLFLGLVLCMGFGDMVERLWFARFAIKTVRDLRAAAFQRAIGPDRAPIRMRSGDLIARLIGDTARIKAGLTGFLVHVATNGTLYLGVTCLMIWLDPLMGAVLAGAGVVLLGITVRGASRAYALASRYRSKEGKLAESIGRASRGSPINAFARVNRKSGRQEAALAKTQGMATFAAHGVFGAAVLIAILLNTVASADGPNPGHLLVLVFYALMLRAPVVQLVRQGTRTGKILACLDRLDQLFAAPAPDAGASPRPPLKERLELIGVTARAGKRRGGRRKLGPVDLAISAGQRVAVVGRAGAGKTTLLRLLAGSERVRKGRILWDGAEMPRTARPGAEGDAVGFVADRPCWRRQPVRALLGLGTEPTEAQAALLAGSGADGVITRLPNALDTFVGPEDLSPGEARALSLARVLLNGPSLILLDAPTTDLNRAAGARVISTMLAGAQGRTLVATFARPPSLDQFDRVIELKKGRVVFDGSPLGWRASAAPLAPGG